MKVQPAIDGMSITEIVARLRALAELQSPAALGLEPNRAWRVACREAADLLEQHEDMANERRFYG